MNSQTTELLEIEIAPKADTALDTLLDTSPTAVNEAAASVPVIGTVVGLADTGAPLVDFASSPAGEPVPARSTCPVSPAELGREVILLFENNDRRHPIILGLLQAPVPPETPAGPISVSLDGEQVTLSAKNEIVLRCGKASITLTRAGKVLIRGAYLLSRSSGVNRIKGASVQIN